MRSLDRDGELESPKQRKLSLFISCVAPSMFISPCLLQLKNYARGKNQWFADSNETGVSKTNASFL